MKIKYLVDKFLTWINPQDTYERGHKAATKAILDGENPLTLYNQACSDIFPSNFTQGWKDACKQYYA